MSGIRKGSLRKIKEERESERAGLCMEKEEGREAERNKENGLRK